MGQGRGPAGRSHSPLPVPPGSIPGSMKESDNEQISRRKAYKLTSFYGTCIKHHRKNVSSQRAVRFGSPSVILIGERAGDAGLLVESKCFFGKMNAPLEKKMGDRIATEDFCVCVCGLLFSAPVMIRFSHVDEILGRGFMTTE